MEQSIQQFMQVSARLFEHLTAIPSSDERDEYIVKTNALLDERGTAIEAIKKEGIILDASYPSYKILFELDQGIIERLEKVMNLIKADLKTLNEQKKNEQQYTNPYSHLQTMDGMYYDKKK